MIVDPTGRYLMTRLGAELWTYDSRWRSAHLFEVGPEDQCATFEGAGYMAVAIFHDEQIVVTVRSPQDPANALATGIFAADQWHFEGDHQLWATVPDYILVPNSDGQKSLLRLADGAHLDPLETVGPVHQAVDIPNSRLLLLVGDGGWSVYDPVPKRSFGRHDLTNKHDQPIMRFRNPDEVWINDAETMMKLEAKHFEVIDAAGSEFSDFGSEPVPPGVGGFARWTFAAGNELCVVPRPNVGDVLVLDAVSMLPVAQAAFSTARPSDAILIRRNVIVAVSEDGLVLRARAKRVRIANPTPAADS